MRWKLLVGNVVAVLLVGILGWVLVGRAASDALVKDVEPTVARSTELLSAVHAQDGDQFADAVEGAARSPEAATVFGGGSDSEQREAAFTFAEGAARTIGAQLPRRGRPAELVAVIDAEGRVLARNSERRLDAGRNVRGEFPAVAHALAAPRGRVVRDYIRYGSEGWLEAVAAPIVAGDQVRGALLVGFAVADSAARSDSQRIGVDVGFLFREGERCTVQSLSVGQQQEKEQLTTWCNANNLQRLLAARQRTRITLGSEEYAAAVVPMPGADTPGNAGAVVLSSVTAARAPASDVALPALLVSLLGLALVVGYNLFLAQYFEKPIEQIEDGLLQIINGNREHRINVEHPELGGIVYRANQLVSELTGVDEGEGGTGGGGG